jgi:hypothetical protein
MIFEKSDPAKKSAVDAIAAAEHIGGVLVLAMGTPRRLTACCDLLLVVESSDRPDPGS